MRWTMRLRQVVNVVNLSTPLGLLVALAGRAGIGRGPDGLLVADHYRLWSRAPAVTVGNVILLRGDRGELVDRPRLLRHESRHATQYAWCLGVLVLGPLYLLASAGSWLWAGDAASYNPFERLAGLADGGYRPPAPRRASRRVGGP